MKTDLLPPLQQSAFDAEIPAQAKARAAERLRHALRGIKLGVRGTSRFFVHFFCAAMIVAAGIVGHCHLLEWCILLGGIAAVLIVELFHSALKALCQGDDRLAQRAQPALAISLGGVLLARLAVALIACLILLTRLLALLPTHGDS
jgi:diacylglycerol kinase